MRCFLSSATPDDPTVVQLTAALADGLLHGDGRHVIVADPAAADAILMVESPRNKFRGYVHLLRRHPLVSAFPEKTFVFDVCDAPVPMLPGLYASLPAAWFDRRRCRAFQYWRSLPLDVVARAVDLHGDREPSLLFSFRGFRTATVRTRILAELNAVDHTSVTETTRQFWHAPNDDPGRLAFVQEILDSAFVLCPRGSGTSSVRLYEVMQLGRVPVVIADEWVPPDGIPWLEVSIRIAEDRVLEIPDILQGHMAHADKMGQRARLAWEEWCQPGPTLAAHIIDSVERLARERPGSIDEARLQRRWESTGFLWKHDLHLVQRALRFGRRRLSSRTASHAADVRPT